MPLNQPSTEKKSPVKVAGKQLSAALAGMPKIPIFSTPDLPIKQTSQEQLPVAEIIDDLVLFKSGAAALILETTSLNFGLLSEKEQQAVIFAYAALLNSLSFSIQIQVRSQKKDITNYLENLDRAGHQIQNAKLKALMVGYKKFILETIKKKNVLSKKFYVIIPLSNLELGVTQSFLSITKRQGPLSFTKSFALKKAKTVLYPRRDHIIRQMGRLGLRLKQLNNSQLIELFFDVYNPIPPAKKKNLEVQSGSTNQSSQAGSGGSTTPSGPPGPGTETLATKPEPVIPVYQQVEAEPAETEKPNPENQPSSTINSTVINQ